MMNRCKCCNTELGEGAQFCPSCGARQVICPACGEPHSEESRFCTMCGAMLAKAAVEPAVEDDLCATQKIVLPPPAELVREEVDYDDEPQKSWYQKNRRPLIFGAIFVILIAVLSSCYFSSQMREDEYQARMVTVCADMTAINEDVLRQMDRLDEKNRTQIASHLLKRLEVVQ
ncbi:MAG: zinc ribbon domain-containing protein, partial [Selenomonadales bacterium]|nr:zinc ribbon domain-containing protein [Selenomonadales bacterium]